MGTKAPMAITEAGVAMYRDQPHAFCRKVGGSSKLLWRQSRHQPRNIAAQNTSAKADKPILDVGPSASVSAYATVVPLDTAARPNVSKRLGK